MTVFQTLALLISLTALFGHLNFRFFRLPMAIGVMVIALLVSLGLVGAGHFHPSIERTVASWLQKVDCLASCSSPARCILTSTTCRNKRE
jgi:CPA1 family monovalent cation:H+ antiporter